MAREVPKISKIGRAAALSLIVVTDVETGWGETGTVALRSAVRLLSDHDEQRLCPCRVSAGGDRGEQFPNLVDRAVTMVSLGWRF
jgi:hypothetical protein